MTKPTIELWLELETRCNLHCKFCFNYWKDGSASPPRRLQSREFLLCLERLLKVVSCSKVTVSGGEPLLRENLDEVLALLRTYGTPVILTTNGVLLNPLKIDWLMRAGVQTFQLPLHSADSATHNFLSGGDCWKNTISALIDLIEAGANTVPVFVATGLNVSHFLGVLRACSAIGIKTFIFNRFIPTGLGTIYKNSIGVPTEPMVWKVLREANILAEQLDLEIQLGTPVSVPNGERNAFTRIGLASCPVGHGQRRWTMDTAGNLRRCNQSGVQFGSLLEGAEEALLREVVGAYSQRSHTQGMNHCGILAQQGLIQIST